MSKPTWDNLARHVRRDIMNTARRGLRPEEVARWKVARRKEPEGLKAIAQATAEVSGRGEGQIIADATEAIVVEAARQFEVAALSAKVIV
jgi:hypothetical protein